MRRGEVDVGQMPIKRQRPHAAVMTTSHVKIDKAAIARNAVCGDARSGTCRAGWWVWPTSVPDSDVNRQIDR
jgi:hypothetical protein